MGVIGTLLVKIWILWVTDLNRSQQGAHYLDFCNWWDYLASLPYSVNILFFICFFDSPKFINLNWVFVQVSECMCDHYDLVLQAINIANNVVPVADNRNDIIQLSCGTKHFEILVRNLLQTTKKKTVFDIIILGFNRLMHFSFSSESIQ